MMVLVTTVLWVAMLAAPVLLLAAMLPAGRECPRCGHETVPLRSRVMHFARMWMARRWCACCGWEGLTRAGLLREAPRPAPAPAAPYEADDDAAWRGGSEGSAY